MNTSNGNPPIQQRRKHASRRAGRLVAAFGIAFAATAAAAPPMVTIEECLESGTRAVSLPGAASGTLSANTCSGCPTLRLRFDDRTAYFIGKAPVNYAKFREAAAKGDFRLDVFYKPQTRVLTRLRLPAAGTEQ